MKCTKKKKVQWTKTQSTGKTNRKRQRKKNIMIKDERKRFIMGWENISTLDKDKTG